MSVGITADAEALPNARNLSRARYRFLDGIRGFAALFVVMHHVQQEAAYHRDIPPVLERATRLLELGHYAVAVFIVLSGFSLMLPLVRSTDYQLPGGFWHYLARRARRILPPYYAAMALSALVFLLLPSLRTQVGWRTDLENPPFDVANLITHALLVHDITPWALKLNSPMWTVATEWHIYFLFPLIFLPVWRRFGIIAAIASGFMIAIFAVGLRVPEVTGSCPWYAGLFTLGMAGAWIATSHHFRALKLLKEVAWLSVTALFGVALAACIKIAPTNLFLSDTLAGVATSSLLSSRT